MADRAHMPSQQWNAEEYASTGRFVADLGEHLLRLLAPKDGERILDLGCGDGALTERIAAAGAVVTGCDADASMVHAARERKLNVVQADMRALPFQGEFDAVFSNAALHWVREQDAVLSGVRESLVSGGRLVAEMGGHGNIAAIRVALQAVASRFGVDAEAQAQSFFPAVETYTALLEKHSFAVEQIVLTPRPTLLKDGLHAWLRTFRRGVIDALPEKVRGAAIAEVCALLAPVLRDDAGNWWADYVRLRFCARRLD